MAKICDEMVKCGLGGDISQILRWEEINSKEIAIVDQMVLPEAGKYPPNSTSKKYFDERARLVEIATFMSNDRG